MTRETATYCVILLLFVLVFPAALSVSAAAPVPTTIPGYPEPTTGAIAPTQTPVVGYPTTSPLQTPLSTILPTQTPVLAGTVLPTLTSAPTATNTPLWTPTARPTITLIAPPPATETIAVSTALPTEVMSTAAPAYPSVPTPTVAKEEYTPLFSENAFWGSAGAIVIITVWLTIRLLRHK